MWAPPFTCIVTYQHIWRSVIFSLYTDVKEALQLYCLICGYSAAENPLFRDTVGAQFTTFQLTTSVGISFHVVHCFYLWWFFFPSRAKWLAEVQDLTGLGKIVIMFMYKQVTHYPISLSTVNIKSRWMTFSKYVRRFPRNPLLKNFSVSSQDTFNSFASKQGLCNWKPQIGL